MLYEITTPEGNTYEVNAPENTSENKLFSYVRKMEQQGAIEKKKVASPSKIPDDVPVEFAPKKDETSDEPYSVSATRKLAFGFEKAQSDVQNAETLLSAKYPILATEISLTPGYFKQYGLIATAEEKFGEDYASLSVNERRKRINQVRGEHLNKKYADVIEAGEADSGWTIAGGLAGTLATPTTLAPVGKSYKAIAGIGALLGLETSVLRQAAIDGELKAGTTARDTLIGAVAAPALVFAGRTGIEAFKKIRNKKTFFSKNKSKTAESKRSVALNNTEEVQDIITAEVQKGTPRSEIMNIVKEKTGRSGFQVLDDTAVSGVTLKVPSIEEARLFADIPESGVTATKRSKEGDLDNYISILSTRIGVISQRLKSRLQNLDMQSHVKTAIYHSRVQDFGKLVNGFGTLNPKKLIPGKQGTVMSTNDRDTFGRYLFNGQFKQAEILLSKYGNEALDQFKKVREVLDDLHEGLVNAGYKNLNKLENYFPRTIRDPEGLRNAIQNMVGGKATINKIDRAIEARKNQLAKAGKFDPEKDLPPQEEAAIINNVLRGYGPKIDNTGLSFVKKRQLETIPPSLMKYYDDPIKSLIDYVDNAVHNIEKRKFFGQDAVNKGGREGMSLDSEESIGTIIQRMKDEEGLGPEAAEELEMLLKARFIDGEKSSGDVIQAYRNVASMTTIANPISALVQGGDLFTAMVTQGMRHTLPAIITNLNPLKGARVTMQSLGLDRVLAEEFVNEKLFAEAMHGLFTLSGFRHIDRFGKNVVLEAALRRGSNVAKSMVKNPDSKLGKAFKEKYELAFGNEYQALVDDLASGNISDNVKLWLWSELAEVQPISLSEMPLKYLMAPDGRVFYTLKTYALKQLDLMRREIVHKYKAGKKFEAVKFGIAYAALVPTGNVVFQAAKDIALGRDIDDVELTDRYADQIWRMFLVSKYIVDREGSAIGTIAAESIFPPHQMLDDLGKALEITPWSSEPASEEDYQKLIRHVPVVGNLFYNFFGGGLERYNERIARENRPPKSLRDL